MGERLRLGGYHPLWRRVPNGYAYRSPSPADRQVRVVGPTTPAPQGLPPWHGAGLGCPRFARHYYGDAISSSGYVRWFSSPGALRHEGRCQSNDWRVAPFGDRGIKACSRLPHAYRRQATSFIGTQRRGILHTLIMSSLRRHLLRCSAEGRRHDVPDSHGGLTTAGL